MIELKTIRQLEEFWQEHTKKGNMPDIKFNQYNYTGKVEWAVSFFKSSDGCTVSANEKGSDLEETVNRALAKFERTKAQGLVALAKPIDSTFEEVEDRPEAAPLDDGIPF